MADWRTSQLNPRRIRPGKETIKRIAEGAAWVKPKEPLDVEEDEGDDWTSDEPRHDPAGCGDPSRDC